jgi:protein SCO1/2
MSRRRTKQHRVQSLIAATVILVAGTAVLWVRTDGARAFTSESARRLAVTSQPRKLPPIQLESSKGRIFTLEALRGRIVVVDFIYTNCPTVCISLGAAFTRLQTSLIESRRDDVHLLSIGFDFRQDTPESLSAYGKRHLADPERWTLARALRPRDLQSLLSIFGVVVIPDKYGGFTHNAAIHVVDRQGRLVRIFDVEDIDSVRVFTRMEQGS